MEDGGEDGHHDQHQHGRDQHFDQRETAISGTVINGTFSEAFGTTGGSRQFDQAAIGAHSTVVTVGFAAEEDMPEGDVGVLGYLYLKNLDAANYVTYGPKDTTMTSFGRIEAGEEVWLRLEPGITLRWQANVGNVQVQMKLFED